MKESSACIITSACVYVHVSNLYDSQDNPNGDWNISYVYEGKDAKIKWDDL